MQTINMRKEPKAADLDIVDLIAGDACDGDIERLTVALRRAVVTQTAAYSIAEADARHAGQTDFADSFKAQKEAGQRLAKKLFQLGLDAAAFDLNGPTEHV